MKSDGNENPNYTVIIVGENGDLYRLTKEKWHVKENLLSDAGGQGIVKQLTEFGAYLSFVPASIAVGIGEICTIVNLQAILKNNIDPKTAKGDGKNDHKKG